MLSSEQRTNSPGRSRFLDRFAEEVAGFNVRSLCLRDLEQQCEARNIDFIIRPLRTLHGIAIELHEFDFVYVNSLIPDPLKTIAGFHELFHILHHIGDTKRCLSTGGVSCLSKNEFQAQVVGVVALMPDSLVASMSVNDIMREFEVSRQIAEFRLLCSL